MENFIFCAVYFGQVEQYSMERLLEFAFILNSPYLIWFSVMELESIDKWMKNNFFSKFT